MGDDPADHLNRDDRIIWDMVRRTASPLRIANAPAGLETLEDFSLLLKSTTPVSQLNVHHVKADIKNAIKVKVTTPHILDRKTHRKISRGAINIDARVDLHGLTQAQAHDLLLHFVQSAMARNLRHVLVITGKGKSFGSEGVLRQALPHWLSTTPFRLYISAYEDAARHHGGHGALYLRLRRSIRT